MLKNLLLVALLGTTISVYAEDDVQQKNTVNHQQLSKRPYTAPVNKAEEIEGNTVDEDTVKQDRVQKTLNLHMLGRRPWIDNRTD